MESKDELIFVDIFFIYYPLSFTCDLSKVTNEILVANVICD
jgi:hypothetical protein